MYDFYFLGFCHKPIFQPMTRKENSSKGNRMSLRDFNKLINLEKKGEKVISWHSKFLWDKLKKIVHDDKDVIELCKYMRRHMHHILLILGSINSKGYKKFLETLLNTKYAYYSNIIFQNFDIKTGNYTKIIKTKGNKLQYKRNAERYKRIAFEQLEKYQLKKNRNIYDLKDREILKYIEFFTIYLFCR